MTGRYPVAISLLLVTVCICMLGLGCYENTIKPHVSYTIYEKAQYEDSALVALQRFADTVQIDGCDTKYSAVSKYFADTDGHVKAHHTCWQGYDVVLNQCISLNWAINDDDIVDDDEYGSEMADIFGSAYMNSETVRHHAVAAGMSEGAPWTEHRYIRWTINLLWAVGQWNYAHKVRYLDDTQTDDMQLQRNILFMWVRMDANSGLVAASYYKYGVVYMNGVAFEQTEDELIASSADSLNLVRSWYDVPNTSGGVSHADRLYWWYHQFIRTHELYHQISMYGSDWEHHGIAATGSPCEFSYTQAWCAFYPVPWRDHAPVDGCDVYSCTKVCKCCWTNFAEPYFRVNPY